jgi:lysozyme
MKKTSQKGIDLIKKYEGLKLKAYLCPANVMTIGYGTTFLPNGVKVPKDSVCTKEEAEMFLKNDLIKFEKHVTKVVTVPINQNQFDALVSFAYNLGSIYPTLLKMINVNPNDERIETQWLKYCYAGKVLLQGLHNRRVAEYKLYNSEV